MKDFNISNHPAIATIERKVELLGMEVSMTQKNLLLILRVKHFVSGAYIPEYDKIVRSTASNELQIPTGEPAPEPTPENPDPQPPTIGEFDYWEAAVGQGAPLIVLLEQGIANLDANGSINAKCNYQA